MTDDPPSSEPRQKSWLERIAQVFSDEPTDTRSLLNLLRNAEQDQVLDADALSIIEGALQVSSMQVREIMIPRSQMTTVSVRQTLAEILDVVVEAAHSRFPVTGENPDQVIGILLAKDLLPLALGDNAERFNLKDMIRPATCVPESKRLNVLLREFRETRNHMAVVIDEYGMVCGLVTIEDVLEQIIGEIDDEYDVDDESYIKPLGDEQYIVKALTPVEEFNEFFGSEFSEDDADTVGGLLLQELRHIPERDETVALGGYQFTVLNADSRQIRLLKLTALPPGAAENID
ncbi:transporter associated domain-containing protein [Pseudohongiella sp. SYSU M77423]|uniref:HlyC/CorC family transporter n=1 Tax=unclassified Pseudohongiella TaxID=2629611 RepID=UPI000C8A12CD|nr:MULTISPECIES: transporter associated domain-containing protein [unclassified Pseudohongiella]MAY56644.1 magnesium/cobalt efflux protein [Gammaproteobacteria bacterium]MDH7944469.1 transporter associated domain-containing protein [Pseudohongiella sp. SYSU M77423]MEC8858615.1 transporter associated domain-containing protein [Pseudomonadota bacterium]|tara:strand:+ start:3762 stop:4628 length:867 start_codon:yes stop_codon:yes gene_type:complete